MRRVLCLALVTLHFACGPVPAPKPPQPPPGAPSWTLTLTSEPAGAVITAVDGPTRELCTTPCTVTLLQQGFTVRAHKDGFTDPAWQPVTLTANRAVAFTLAPQAVALQPLHADGRIFRTADGQAWRYKGVSAFALLDRFAKGQDISDTLNAYKGFNVLRVWPYVPAKDWGAKAWNVPGPGVVLAFLARVAQAGFYVELTLLTDDDPARIAWARAFVNDLARARPGNVLIEIGNEPTTHKNINTAALKTTLDASGFLYASGNYEDSAKAFGSYLVAHTQRDPEWPRRAHDALEFFQGGGPNTPTDPAHRVPCVLDEPAKLQDVAAKADDWRAYFGAASLLGAGATFHSETGKFGLPPTAAEAQLGAAALEGLNAFPANAPNGAYSRYVESSLRTYQVGPYMVRVRPTTPAPIGQWRRIGSSNVLWQR